MIQTAEEDLMYNVLCHRGYLVFFYDSEITMKPTLSPLIDLWIKGIKGPLTDLWINASLISFCCLISKQASEKQDNFS